MVMSEELKGDYECDECGYAEHNPKDKICPKCGGELSYMMTLQDLVAEITKENDQLRSENEKLKEALRYIVDRGYTGASYVAQQALNEVTK